MCEDPERVYVDLTLFNNTFLNSDIGRPDPIQYIPAVVTQQRPAPFLVNPQKYNMTIVRFSISGSLIARAVQSPLSTPTLTRLFAGLKYNGVHYDESIVFPTITSPILKQEKLEYSIYGIVDQINDAFLRSQNRIVAEGGYTGASFGQVFVTFEPTTGFYEIKIPEHYGVGSGATGDGSVGVFMSYFLFQKIGSSFPSIQQAPLLYNKHDIEISKTWRGDNRVSGANFYFGPSGPTGGTGYYMVIKQDAAWPSSSIDINRLVITSNDLPIDPEYRFRQDYSSIENSNGNQITKQVTDILIGSDAELQSRQESLTYIPSLYRLIPLTGSTPLTKIDIKFEIADKSSNTYPLFISPGSTIQVKLLFLKKGLSN